MAASLTGNFTLALTTAAGVIRNLILSPVTLVLTGSNYKQQTQTIPTTAGGVAIDVSGLTTPRWIAIINRDATNFVDILTAVSGTAFARLKPGEGMMLPLNSGITAIAAQANTASVAIEVLVVEN